MNTDKQGNKIAEKRVSDSIKGKQNRILAAEKSRHALAANIKDSHCTECGFRVRGVGHTNGQHHIQNANLEN